MSHRMDTSDVAALVKLAVALADRRGDPGGAADLLLQRLRELTGGASAFLGRVSGTGPLQPYRGSGQRVTPDAPLLTRVLAGADTVSPPIIHPASRVNGRAVYSALPLGDGVASVIGLHQPRTARRRWGLRERTLIDLLHPEITWLYVASTKTADDADLSPRQRQTLRLLLRGLSEKQIATQLKLSVHTVHVYVKAIYKAHHITSRAELLAKWVKQ